MPLTLGPSCSLGRYFQIHKENRNAFQNAFCCNKRSLIIILTPPHQSRVYPTARFWSSSVDQAEPTRWPFVSSLDCRNILSRTYRILLLLSCSEYQFKDEIKITTSTHDIYRRILRKLFQGLLSDSKKCAISHDYLFLNS